MTPLPVVTNADCQISSVITYTFILHENTSRPYHQRTLILRWNIANARVCFEIWTDGNTILGPALNIARNYSFHYSPQVRMSQNCHISSLSCADV